jgi:F-type H+-transporting ATPase subunit gamma
MANTREIRRRIKSIKNTAQITKAMQMVAAAKMRRAQQAAIAGRPYAHMLDEIAANLAAAGSDFTHPLLEVREVKKVGVIVISTDKGLCGALNTNLFREVLRAEKGNEVYVSLGRKAKAFLGRLQKNLVADFELKDSFSFRDSKRISQFLIDSFLKHEIDAVDIFYTQFVNTLNQKPVRVRLVPIGRDELHLTKSGETRKGNDYLFEPNANQLLASLLPFFVHQEVYQMVLNARASEHSARMVAMKSATDNAKQLVKDLSLEYNKVRQASITTELLEITTAQMVLD